jgi:hypothetical protein
MRRITCFEQAAIQTDDENEPVGTHRFTEE